MIKTIHRRALNEELEKAFKRLKPGKVLDAGGANSPYKELIPATEYLVLEKHKEFNPDICCDVHDIKAKNNNFDTVIATELLEHTENPKQVVSEFHRVLKKGGICITTTPWLYPVHEDKFMKDYWRFTPNGLRELFKKFSKVEVTQIGSTSTTFLNIFFNRFAFLNRLSPIFYKFRTGNNGSGYLVYAKK